MKNEKILHKQLVVEKKTQLLGEGDKMSNQN